MRRRLAALAILMVSVISVLLAGSANWTWR